MNAKQKKIIAVFNFSDKEYQYRLRKENVNQMEWLFASDNEHHHEGRETYSQRKWFPGTSGKVFSKVFFGRNSK